MAPKEKKFRKSPTANNNSSLDQYTKFLLEACGQFGTIESHAKEICLWEEYNSHYQRTKLSADNSIIGNALLTLLEKFTRTMFKVSKYRIPINDTRYKNIHNKLRNLVEKGMLLEEQSTINNILKNFESFTPQIASRISKIAVYTHNNATMLQSNLEGLVLNMKKFSQQRPIIVFDGSNVEQKRKTQIAVKTIIDKYHHPISVVDEDRKSRYCKLLSQTTGIPIEIIRFAICRHDNWPDSDGYNRNAAMLITGDDAVLTLNHDLACVFTIHPDYQPKTILYTQNDPQDYFFFDKENDCQEFGKPTDDFDLVGAHEKLIGKSPADIWSGIKNKENNSNKSFNITSVSDRMLSNDFLTNARIRTSHIGLAGHSGMTLNNHLYFLNGDQFIYNIVSRTKEWFEIIERSPWQVRHTKSIALTTNQVFLPSCAAFDLKEPLPPFPPSFRGNDTVFGVFVASALKNYLAGYLPIAMQHKHPIYRPLNQNFTDRFTSVCFALSEIINRVALDSNLEKQRTTANQIEEVGNQLLLLSNLEKSEFENYTIDLIKNSMEKTSEAIIYQLVSMDGPTFWKNTIDNINLEIEFFRRSQNYKHKLIVDMPKLIGDAWEMFQRFTRNYAQLVIKWPKIIEGAKKLQSKGISMENL